MTIIAHTRPAVQPTDDDMAYVAADDSINGCNKLAAMQAARIANETPAERAEMEDLADRIRATMLAAAKAEQVDTDPAVEYMTEVNAFQAMSIDQAVKLADEINARRAELAELPPARTLRDLRDRHQTAVALDREEFELRRAHPTAFDARPVDLDQAAEEAVAAADNAGGLDTDAGAEALLTVTAAHIGRAVDGTGQHADRGREQIKKIEHQKVTARHMPWCDTNACDTSIDDGAAPYHRGHPLTVRSAYAIEQTHAEVFIVCNPLPYGRVPRGGDDGMPKILVQANGASLTAQGARALAANLLYLADQAEKSGRHLVGVSG